MGGRGKGLFGSYSMVVATPIYTDGDDEAMAYAPSPAAETRLDGYRVSTVRLDTKEEVKRGVDFRLLGKGRVAYARLPSFSRHTTQELVDEFKNVNVGRLDGVVLDLRNNPGGVIQEAFMLASSIIGVDAQDTVLAYTLDSRGAFRPQEVGEFFGDHRFPGFFLSRSGEMDERRKGSDEEYMKPSSFKSLGERSKEKRVERRRAGLRGDRGFNPKHPRIVLLVNEGTASSAEVFSAALRDNGHATIVGTRTYGKGLIQHLYPLGSDGEVLKLTIGEYLTPKLQHVSKVGGAKAGGGGIKPNIVCRSEVVPQDKSGDLCVLRALEEFGVEELEP